VLLASDAVGIAGGQASVAEKTSAVAPWLCVAAFRRVCSEQRANSFATRHFVR